MKYIIIVIFLFSVYTNVFAGDKKEMFELSRKSCVKVVSVTGNAKGSGFFIAEDLVVSCFHVIAEIDQVVAKIKQNENNISENIFQDIKIITIDGEEIDAHCISPPSRAELSPLINDFAIIKLSSKPTNLSGYILELTDDDLQDLSIGENCYYSGYPLAVPTIITNKGIISGIAQNINIICVQGCINKGNSGGALISEKGKVLGIISMREGGISKGLQELTLYIESTSKQGSVKIMGVDPLQAIKATVETLDKYISTGLGYARYISSLEEYCKKYNIKIGS